MTPILANRIPLFYRGFALLFVGGVAAMTWVEIRDRGTTAPSAWMPLLLTVFWLAGLGTLAWAFRQEIVHVEQTGPGRLVLIRSSGLRRRRVPIAADGVVEIAVRAGKDSEGDPYFRVVLALRGEPDAVVWEGHDRRRAEERAGRLRSALGL